MSDVQNTTTTAASPVTDSTTAHQTETTKEVPTIDDPVHIDAPTSEYKRPDDPMTTKTVTEDSPAEDQTRDAVATTQPKDEIVPVEQKKEEVAAPAKTEKVVEPITEGQLAHKGPGFLK